MNYTPKSSIFSCRLTLHICVIHDVFCVCSPTADGVQIFSRVRQIPDLKE
jgi:hypothetical protein